MTKEANPVIALHGFTDACAFRFFSLGRFALVDGLRALDFAPGAFVLVPAFICRDLLAAIHAVAAVPIFYSVNQRLEPNDPSEAWPSGAEVLAVNYFGFAQDLSPFLGYCKRTGAILIEDNANGFLSAETSGTLLGARGDFDLIRMQYLFFRAPMVQHCF
jgi:dTDP-4-amino-4,6-dideoxygalactose transaminase